jgi:L-amino acid N-acyltransferase YncA
MKQFTISAMQSEHWARVAEIYRSGIETKLATFESSVPTWEHWNATHLSFARLVAIVDNRIEGWAALAPVSSRKVYSGVAEVSVYVDTTFRGQGCGSLLLETLIAESERNNIWTLQASIFSENERSLRLHLKCGFREVGRRFKIAKLDGEWKDTILLERRSSTVGTH